MATAIDTISNKVISTIPIGQTTQAIVFVPNAVPTGTGAENLAPLGEAGDTALLRLAAADTAMPTAEASVAVNSLGLLDLIQITARGLTPKAQYQVWLADSNHAPFGRLEPLAVLKTNPDGAGVAQAVGPMKSLTGHSNNPAGEPRRFVIVTESKDAARVVLRQVKSATTSHQ